MFSPFIRTASETPGQLLTPFSVPPGALHASTLNDTNQNYHDRDGLEHGTFPFAINWPFVNLAAHCRLTTTSAGATRVA